MDLISCNEQLSMSATSRFMHINIVNFQRQMKMQLVRYDEEEQV